MKRITLLLLAVLCSYGLSAQNWLTDFDQAQAQASEQHLPIVLVFQGSDWCAPCIRLDREIWSTDAFREYAPEHFVMLKADFPRRKQNVLPAEQAAANAKLAERYNKNGIFPLVLVLDAEGKVLGHAGYERLSPEQYIEKLESFTRS